jgi:hypothetical protein
MTHADNCQADTGHTLDCATATELAKLRAFAEAVRDEWECPEKTPSDGEDYPDGCGDVDDCWHCYAAQALERVR